MTSAPYIQVAGKSNILIGFPSDDYAVCHRIGEQMDETRLSVTPIFHDVPGDSQGGPQGDPIERQILALNIRGVLNLSKWDHTIRDRIERHNLMSNEGSFADNEIGGLTLRDRSFRIVISPSRSNPIPATDPISTEAHPDAGLDYFFRNFVCCVLDSPIETGQGTKFSALQFSFRAFRAPEGHALAPSGSGASYRDGLIWNRDATGVDDDYLPLTMRSDYTP
jgi:hypothetical protein